MSARLGLDKKHVFSSAALIVCGCALVYAGLSVRPELMTPTSITVVVGIAIVLSSGLLWSRNTTGELSSIAEVFDAHSDLTNLQDLISVLEKEPSESNRTIARFIEAVHDRISTVETESQNLVTQEKFLSYRAQRYQSILQAMPDGILILDEDFKVAFVNQHVEDMFKISSTDVQSSSVEEWCEYEHLVAYVRNLKRSGLQAATDDATMPAPNAPDRTFGLSAHPLYFSKSPTSNSGILILLRDISHEVAAKRSRGEFVGSVSHEVKAPLNTIGLYAQMLEENVSDQDFVLEAHNAITQEVERMSRLINNLMKMTQMEMGTFELDEHRANLVDIISECVDMLDHGEDQARIQVSCDDAITPVLVDKELLRVAISNLMTNALKYSPKDRPVVVSVQESDMAITVGVSDQGQGITPEEQEKIFSKFYRSNNEETHAESGHGLGLAIAQEIVHLHHGGIRLESTPGEGTTFYIELWKHTGIAQQAI